MQFQQYQIFPRKTPRKLHLHLAIDIAVVGPNNGFITIILFYFFLTVHENWDRITP